MSKISDYCFMLTFGLLVSTATVSAAKARAHEIPIQGVVSPNITITPEIDSTTTEFTLELNSNEPPLTVRRDGDSTAFTKVYSVNVHKR